jgi:hypothetical protein
MIIDSPYVGVTRYGLGLEDPPRSDKPHLFKEHGAWHAVSDVGALPEKGQLRLHRQAAEWAKEVTARPILSGSPSQNG